MVSQTSFGKQDCAREEQTGGQGVRGWKGRNKQQTTRRKENRTHAWGCGTFTMEPLMLPMKTMLPFALRSMRWRATAVAKR